MEAIGFQAGNPMGSVRLALALIVVVTHNGMIFPPAAATTAVHLFFVISGFYMALVLNTKYTEANPARFYVARYLRLWPAYAVVVAFVAFARPIADITSFGLVISLYFYFCLFFLIGSETLWWFELSPPNGIAWHLGAAPPLAEYTGVPQMWSVGIELVFYFVAPLFSRRARAATVVLILAFFVHVIITLTEKPFLEFATRAPFNLLWMFVLGVVSYFVYDRYRQELSGIRISPHYASAIGVVVTISLLLLRVAALGNEWWAIFPDLFLFLFAAIVPPLFHFTCHNKSDRLIGEFSYPVYVVHWPIMAIGFPQTLGQALPTISIVLLTLAAAFPLFLLDQRIAPLRAGSKPASPRPSQVQRSAPLPLQAEMRGKRS